MKITYRVTAKNKHGNKEWTEAPDRTTREAKTDRFRPLSDAAKKVNNQGPIGERENNIRS